MTITYPWASKTIHYETCTCTLCLIDLDLKDEGLDDKITTFIDNGGKPQFKCSKCTFINAVHQNILKHYSLFHETKL